MENQPQGGENKPHGGNREQKRAQFAESAPAQPKTTIMLVGGAVVLAAIAAFVVVRGRSDNPAATAVGGATTDIRIPLSDLGSQAKFFNYTTADNKKMRFFALRSSDGSFRVALDACDTCYHAGKGYHQEGDDMVCNNCGQHFPSAQVNDVHGGCNPVGLPRAVEGDALVVKTSDLEARRQYF